MSRCAWPCCGRCSDREVRLSERRCSCRRRSRRRRDRRARRRRARRRRRRSPRSAPASTRRPARPVLDAEGCVVAPGLVDIQVHFREPGREEAETIETGARAAALGGCTAVVCMPNTDAAARRRRGRAVGARAGPRGRVRRARRRLHHQGPRAARSSRRWASSTTSACGCSPTTATASPTRDVMRARVRVRARAARRGARAARRGSRRSSRGGHMHEGAWSAQLGIPGRPAEAESSIVARDLALAKLTGGRYHVLHLSTAQSRRARARGQGRRRARHRRVHAAAPRAHRRGVRVASTRCSR